MEKYRVIGGQYYFKDYGGAKTLKEARKKAEENIEYWDNWQGWHTPAIYLTKDCTQDKDGEMMPEYSPYMGHHARPYEIHDGKKWIR